MRAESYRFSRENFSRVALAAFALFAAGAGRLQAQSTQQSTSANGPIDPTQYPLVRAITASSGDSWATIGNQTASNDGNNGSASVAVYGLYKGPNGDWWAAHVNLWATDDDNGDVTSDAFGVDLGSTDLSVSCDNGTDTPDTGCTVLYGAGGIPFGNLDAATNGGGELVQGQNITLVGWAADLMNTSSTATVEIFDVQNSNGTVPFSATATGTAQSLPNVWGFPASFLGTSPMASFSVPGNIARPDVVALSQLSAVSESGWAMTLSTAQLASGAYHTLYVFSVCNGVAWCIGSTEFYLTTGSVPPTFSAAIVPLQGSGTTTAHNVPIILTWQTSASGNLSLSGSGITGTQTVPASGAYEVIPAMGSASWTLTGAPGGTLTASTTVGKAFQTPIVVSASPAAQSPGPATIDSSFSFGAGAWLVPWGATVTFSAQGGSGTGSDTWTGGNAPATGSTYTASFAGYWNNSITVTNAGDANYLPATASMTVFPVPSTSVGSFTVAPSTSSPLQATVSLTVNDPNGYQSQTQDMAPVTYTITGGGVSYSGTYNGAQQITLNGLNSGTDTFTVTVTDEFGFQTTSTANATISPLAQTVYLSPGALTATLGVAQSITLSASGGNTGYVWGGSASGSGSSKTLSFSSTGTYTVTAYSPSGSGYAQSNTATTTITVTAAAPSNPTTDTLLAADTYLFDGPATQSYTPPSGANYVVVKAFGAGGGWYPPTHEYAISGGTGALAIAWYNANPGDAFTVAVAAGGAGSGTSNTENMGGWPGGGTGFFAGGGGGFSKVQTPYGTVWAGGGGGSANIASQTTSAGGGNGGSPNGAAGWGGAGSDGGGGGATTTAFGLGSYYYGNNGDFEIGGSASTFGGAGGGGGYYGGGSGGNYGTLSSPDTNGGGGGSSFQIGSGYNLTYQVGGASDPWYPGNNVAVGASASSAPNGGNGAVVILAYEAVSPGAMGAQTFAPTGSSQSYTVPDGAGYVVVKAWGGGGGAPSSYAGGAGDFVTGSFAVTPGQIITVSPGAAGASNGSSSPGSAGGNSSVTLPSGGSLLSAGGNGATTSAAGGNGGAGSSTVTGNTSLPLAASTAHGTGTVAAGASDSAYPGNSTGCGGVSNQAGGPGGVVIIAYPPVPAFTNSLIEASQPNQSVDFFLTTQSGATAYTASGLPPGLTLNAATGEITGTVTTAGTYSVTITATNGVGSSESTLTWYVESSAPSVPASRRRIAQWS